MCARAAAAAVEERATRRDGRAARMGMGWGIGMGQRCVALEGFRQSQAQCPVPSAQCSVLFRARRRCCCSNQPHKALLFCPSNHCHPHLLHAVALIDCSLIPSPSHTTPVATAFASFAVPAKPALVVPAPSLLTSSLRFHSPPSAKQPPNSPPNPPRSRAQSASIGI